MAASERCTQAVAALPTLRQDTDTWWTGTAGGAFADRVRGLPAQVTEIQKALRATTDVLDEWASSLLANQRRAEHLDQRALRLRRAIRSASDDADNATTVAQFSSDPDADHKRRNAVAQHEGLLGELDAVLEEARMLERDHLATARRVAERLRAFDTGSVDVPVQVPDQAELFAGVMSAVTGQSAFADNLAGMLFGRRGSQTEPVHGAVASFASALAR